MYMMWFDDRPKMLTDAKIYEAVNAYVRHFHAQPNVVLVSEADKTAQAPDGVAVRADKMVRPNNFWVGLEVQP